MTRTDPLTETDDSQSIRGYFCLNVAFHYPSPFPYNRPFADIIYYKVIIKGALSPVIALAILSAIFTVQNNFLTVQCPQFLRGRS
jgi:hypothetical protein